MTNYAILAGGPDGYLPENLFETYSHFEWIGVDRGTYDLVKNGIEPVKAFGDFDSINEDERQWLKSKLSDFTIFPEEKDETDLEIAFNWALNEKPDNILIFGATGGRLDHSMINIQMLYLGASHDINVKLIDAQNETMMLRPGKYTFHPDGQYEYYSFIAHSKKVGGITLVGFKYPLNKATLEWGSSLCISNEIIEDSAQLVFDEGWLLYIKSKD